MEMVLITDLITITLANGASRLILGNIDFFESQSALCVGKRDSTAFFMSILINLIIFLPLPQGCANRDRAWIKYNR